jgi:hypothetical protein
MIAFNLVNDDSDHLIIRTDEPSRFEIILTNEGQLIIFGYKGKEDNKDQEPDICYDTLN